jgi:hypothetical protein
VKFVGDAGIFERLTAFHALARGGIFSRNNFRKSSRSIGHALRPAAARAFAATSCLVSGEPVHRLPSTGLIFKVDIGQRLPRP